MIVKKITKLDNPPKKDAKKSLTFDTCLLSKIASPINNIKSNKKLIIKT